MPHPEELRYHAMPLGLQGSFPVRCEAWHMGSGIFLSISVSHTQQLEIFHHIPAV